MKATGIVRKIDELGRIVIPKEIRRTMRIREGDPLEIFTDRAGGVMLRKYSPMGEMSRLGEDCCEALQKATGRTAAVADRDGVVAAAGEKKGLLLEQPLTRELLQIMEERRLFVPMPAGIRPPVAPEAGLLAAGVMPLLAEGDVLGCLLLGDDGGSGYLHEEESLLLRTMGHFMARQLEG